MTVAGPTLTLGACIGRGFVDGTGLTIWPCSTRGMFRCRSVCGGRGGGVKFTLGGGERVPDEDDFALVDDDVVLRVCPHAKPDK